MLWCEWSSFKPHFFCVLLHALDWYGELLSWVMLDSIPNKLKLLSSAGHRFAKSVLLITSSSGQQE